MTAADRDLSLDELIDDPLVRLVMRRDGVTPEALRRLLESVRARRRSADAPVPVPA